MLFAHAAMPDCLSIEIEKEEQKKKANPTEKMQLFHWTWSVLRRFFLLFGMQRRL